MREALRIAAAIASGLVGSALLCACSPDAPSGLYAGQCREDRDCPGPLVCVGDEPAGSVRRCGCRTDEQCPSWSATFYEEAGGEPRSRSFAVRCELATRQCACGSDPDSTLQCPPGLKCVVDKCVCEADQDCPPDCRCSSGSCVHSRGDDVILCDYRRSPDDRPRRADAGPDGG